MTNLDLHRVRVASWNLNGIRAAAKNGFFNWLELLPADIVLLQEVRCADEDLQREWLEPFGYKGAWHAAQKKGYSGVGIYTRVPVDTQNIFVGLGNPEFDNEGRFLAVVVGKVVYVSAYFPNSQRAGQRLPYKLAFCEAALKRMQEFRKQGLGVVIGGDFNIAHTAIDLANPKQNEKNAGYLPEERAWLTQFIQEGYIDSFRMFEQGGGHYTWWKQFPPGVRERNIGWRIDYHFVSEELRKNVCSAKIHSDVLGSDHCPVSLVLEGL